MKRELRNALHRLPSEFSKEQIQATSELFAPLVPRPTSGACDVERNIPYGEHERHRLDIFHAVKPADAGTASVILFVHGGGFIAGDKGSVDSPFYNHVGAWAVTNGMIGVTINYRLAPTFPWPAGPEDIASALSWIFANISRYGGNPARVFIMGQSAGAAHVASYVGLPALHTRNHPIAGAIMISGLYDLTSLPIHSQFEKAYYGEDATKFAERSPLEALVNASIPCFYCVADLDSFIFQQQAAKVVERYLAIKKAWPYMLYLPDQNHLSTIMQLGSPDDSLGPALLTIMNHHSVNNPSHKNMGQKMNNSMFNRHISFPVTEDLNYIEVRSGQVMGTIRPWEFNGWKAESMSWKTGCYIHPGLSGSGRFVFKGPEAGKFLESICTNSFAKFPVGSMKHAVMCNKKGLVAAHGILQRQHEDEYHFFAGGPWPALMAQKSSYKVDVENLNHYLFQIAGPKSRETLERATGEDLRDIAFLRFRTTNINGTESEIGRIGMSGNLAYELRGPIEDGPKIFEAVLEAGREFGIEGLGWRTYLVNHIEGGFPQATWTMATASDDDNEPMLRKFWHFSGSVDPENLRARFRNPLEIGWGKTVKFDHEFHGREAVEAEAANPKRTVVTLRWNHEDVLDIYASLLRKEEEFKTLDLPYSPNRWPMAHADHILKDGREIGISSGTIYSYYFREFLSMACIEIDHAAIGSEVIVQWGDYGKKIKNVRATVERFPFLTEGRNSDLDLSGKL